MKTLFLVRHAKSDWPAHVSDFDRPLSERGHRDAPKMAEFLKSKNVEIDTFVSSPAKRAITTCRYFAEIFENMLKISWWLEPAFLVLLWRRVFLQVD